jgi:uncharacterized protein YjbI with pentapeptide repeats
MTQEELDRILEDHHRWLWHRWEYGILRERSDVSGRNANLAGKNLQGLNLRWADLSRASLAGACFRRADLRGVRMPVRILEADFGGTRSNWITRMTARGALVINAAQRRDLGMAREPR